MPDEEYRNLTTRRVHPRTPEALSPMFSNDYKWRMCTAYPYIASGVPGKKFDPWAANSTAERDEAFERVLKAKNIARTHISELKNKIWDLENGVKIFEELLAVDDAGTDSQEIDDEEEVDTDPKPTPKPTPSALRSAAMKASIADVVGWFDPTAPNEKVEINGGPHSKNLAMLAYYFAQGKPLVRLVSVDDGVDITVPLSALVMLFRKIYPNAELPLLPFSPIKKTQSFSPTLDSTPPAPDYLFTVWDKPHVCPGRRSRCGTVPSQVNAIQWTGENAEQVQAWIGSNFEANGLLYVAANDRWVPLEKDEWILEDELGFYPCNNKVFRRKYEITEVVPKFTVNPITPTPIPPT